MKIVTVIGARPQFIKASVVSQALHNYPNISEIIIHTGQHFDHNMSAIFFEDMKIPQPKYHLNINSLSHGAMTGRMLEQIETILITERPDKVLVYGDTNSTLAGALAAKKLHIPIAHVEAGLRSFNQNMPEEVNRILTDHMADLLFAPTSCAVSNLKSEGIAPSRIHYVGDVMYDAALFYAEKAEVLQNSLFSDLQIEKNNYILATVHREKNTNDRERLDKIFALLINLSEKIPVVLPLHPRTRKMLADYSIKIPDSKSFKLIDPLGYLEILLVEKNATAIMTDSGGMQKESYFFKVPCFTLRDETEWGELVDLGWNTLLHLNDSIDDVDKVFSVIRSKNQLKYVSSLYGDGHAADHIIQCLINSK